MKKVTKIHPDGAVEHYDSVSEAARANGITVQRLYARIQWGTLWQGCRYVSDEIEPVDKADRNAKRRAKYVHRPRKPRKPSPPKPRPPKERAEKPREKEQKLTRRQRERERWVRIVPPPYDFLCREYMICEMDKDKELKAKAAFSRWYCRYCPVYISSDLICKTARYKPRNTDGIDA